MSRILVADDDGDIRALIVRKLRSAGHEVIEASDGVEALAAARATSPDLALLDLMMPGISGTEVVATLRTDPRFATTPLVLLTARAQASDAEEGLAAGATAYLSKPFSPRELVAHLAPYLERDTPDA